MFPLATIQIASWECTMYQNDLIKECWQVRLDRDCISGFLISQCKDDWKVAKHHGVDDFRWSLAHLFLFECCHILLLAYLLCVVYLTIESYASLRDPPAVTAQLNHQRSLDTKGRDHQRSLAMTQRAALGMTRPSTRNCKWNRATSPSPRSSPHLRPHLQ